MQKGIELRKAQHDAEALEVFRLAYAKAKTPRILAQTASRSRRSASGSRRRPIWWAPSTTPTIRGS